MCIRTFLVLVYSLRHATLYFSVFMALINIFFSLHCKIDFYVEYEEALIPTFNANTQKLGLNGGFIDF